MVSIREAAEKLSQVEDRKEKLAEKFQDINFIEVDSTVKESFLSRKIEPENPGSVAGIDGGLVKKRYSSGDVVAARAVAAVFNFNDDLEVSYLPSKSPEPDFQVFNAHEADSLDRNAESERLKKETSIIMDALEEASTILVDGSVVPGYLEDDEVLENYNRIFEKAEKGKMVGVVEDSYGLKLCSILEGKLGVELGDVRDTVLMDTVLEKGERSFVRRYSTSPVEHPVLEKLEDRHVNNLQTFYVKLSEHDLPLRIDYYGEKEDADEIAGKLMSLKSSRSYTVPSPIVEADKRAKIPETYIKRLEKRFSPGLKRRDRRSF